MIFIHRSARMVQELYLRPPDLEIQRYGLLMHTAHIKLQMTQMKTT